MRVPCGLRAFPVYFESLKPCRASRSRAFDDAGCFNANWKRFIGIVAAAVMMGSGAEARSPDRPVIRLNCPEEAAAALCRSLIQSLSEMAPTAVIRRVPAHDVTPTRPGDLGVSLVVAKAGAEQITGRLDWQQGAGARHTGPAVRFGAEGAHEAFARALVKASPDMRAALLTGRKK